VPIGYPIANTQIHLLDSQGRQVPIGIPGELHIGGAGLARGYLHRPDLTAAAFIPNPFGPPDAPRLYKTGDLARYRPDGAIAFLGRLDHQVKLHGFRIELGEIEACLARHPGVRQAVVSRREDPPGHPQLIAYVVPSAGGELSALALDEIRDTLEPHLPDYMMPTAIMGLPELPLLPNGKIDRRALPAPQGAGAPADAFVAPRNATETHLATLWREILHVERVGIHDPFFTLGGNSLIATRLTSRLRAAFDLDLPLRTLFERPTIAALAAHIEALQMALQHRDHAETSGRKEITL
jgi:acyl carrier protein